MKRPTKIKSVMATVRKMVVEGTYRYVGHANKRIQERCVSRLEVKQILKNGYHEKKKDEYKEEHNSWNYSIRGKTVDKRNLRIAITFNPNNMLIVTVIDLDK